ncbi:MAG: hypothetical protein BHW64_02160 [Candidatus Melainabacteria bacterium LEY3_CP_29_8]|nr:MAG: hypothetical protein BHW64_02160 [Candidatus Melainabacteria bacterium LEY3_CP_29_8]
MFPLANIPNHLQNRFKSKGELAKRVAYTYHKLQQTQQDERTSMEFYDESNQRIKLSIAPSYNKDVLFTYKNDSFMQQEFKDCSRALSDANTFDSVQISEDGATTTHKNLYTQELINIPGPSLVTNKDGSSQTKYNYYTSVHYDKDTRTYSITKFHIYIKTHLQKDKNLKTNLIVFNIKKNYLTNLLTLQQ